jgi:DNA polymerase III subunit beta
MKVIVDREALLKPLLLVTGVVERRHTLPVLANLLVQADENGLALTGTDLEVELAVQLHHGVQVEAAGTATLPARKLADIWRALPEHAQVTIQIDGDRAQVRAGRSRFTLATLPSADFPRVEAAPGDIEFVLPRADLRRLLDHTGFSMAQQDVRYYFNGLLLEVTPRHVRAVATDGHRMAIATRTPGVDGTERNQAIVPRKGVAELSRLLAEESDDTRISLGRNHLQVVVGGFRLTTKLVDARFPEYEPVIPRDCDNAFEGDRESLRQALHRASILSNEKYRGIRLHLAAEQLTLHANNPEQEEAEEAVPVQYSGEALETSFNVGYLQDVLNVLRTDAVRVSISQSIGSALIEGVDGDDSLYIVMPMRL